LDHSDPERAVAESPYGGTLAHGFLILSFISNFMDTCNLRPSDSTFALISWVDKVRFLAQVIVGDGFRIRDHTRLLEVERRPKGLLWLPPEEYCRGTRPNQVAKFRPQRKLSIWRRKGLDGQGVNRPNTRHRLQT
jgi:acyl dehydratase